MNILFIRQSAIVSLKKYIIPLIFLYLDPLCAAAAESLESPARGVDEAGDSDGCSAGEESSEQTRQRWAEFKLKVF